MAKKKTSNTTTPAPAADAGKRAVEELERFGKEILALSEKAQGMIEAISEKDIIKVSEPFSGYLQEKCASLCLGKNPTPYRRPERCRECMHQTLRGIVDENILKYFQYGQFSEHSEYLPETISKRFIEARKEFTRQLCDGLSRLRNLFGEAGVNPPIWANDSRPERLELFYLLDHNEGRFYATGAVPLAYPYIGNSILKMCDAFNETLDMLRDIPEFIPPRFSHEPSMWGLEKISPAYYSAIGAAEACLLNQPKILQAIRSVFDCSGDHFLVVLGFVSHFVKTGYLVLDGDTESILSTLEILGQHPSAKYNGIRLKSDTSETKIAPETVSTAPPAVAAGAMLGVAGEMDAATPPKREEEQLHEAGCVGNPQSAALVDSGVLSSCPSWWEDGYEQKEIAGMAGCSEAYISQLVNGKKKKCPFACDEFDGKTKIEPESGKKWADAYKEKHSKTVKLR